MKALLTFLLVLTAAGFSQEKPNVPLPDVETTIERSAQPQNPPVSPAQRRRRPVPPARQPHPNAPDVVLMRKIAQAWETLNPDNVAQYYAKDPELVFYDIMPMKYTGWQQYADGVRKLFAGFKSMKWTINDDAQVYAEEYGALGTATWHIDLVTPDNKTESLDGRWTVIWERRGDSWLIVHEHVSAPSR
ncbi:MAG: nuclear transport factor 2 family protein [Terriglobales bacterium]